MSQMNLFGNQLSGEGLDVKLVTQLFDGRTSEEYFQSLLAGIPWQQDEIVMFGKKTPLPRLTSWFGDRGAT